MEQKKMSSTRFYVVLLIILSLSILILSLSYSRESGNTFFNETVEKVNNLKIVYANGKDIHESVVSLKKYEKAKEYAFSVTNESKSDSYYELDIICDNCYGGDYYYSIDDEEPALITSRVALEENLTKYGSERDFAMHSLRVFSPTSAINNISFQVKKVKRNTLEYYINKDINALIEKNNYVFKEDANTNYVLKDEILYQIKEIKNDMVLCEAVDESVEEEYRFATFNKKMDILQGNGSLESPYEVDYES